MTYPPENETPFQRQAREAYLAALKPGGGKDFDLIYKANDDYEETLRTGRLVGLLATGAQRHSPQSSGESRIREVARPAAPLVAQTELERGGAAAGAVLGKEPRNPTSTQCERGSGAAAALALLGKTLTARATPPPSRPAAAPAPISETERGATAAAALGKMSAAGGAAPSSRAAAPLAPRSEFERGAAADAAVLGKEINADRVAAPFAPPAAAEAKSTAAILAGRAEIERGATAAAKALGKPAPTASLAPSAPKSQPHFSDQTETDRGRIAAERLLGRGGAA
jgi:hypothetical protein